jgi:hypothetical protein
MQSTRCSCRILIKLGLSRQRFEKQHKYQVSSKFVQWEPSCSMRTDGKTGMKLTVAFRNFANETKNEHKKQKKKKKKKKKRKKHS